MDKKNDTFYINEALKQAKIAAKYGDIPVGCIVVYRENKRNKKMCEIAKSCGFEEYYTYEKRIPTPHAL